jgi:hypothetical protein
MALDEGRKWKWASTLSGYVAPQPYVTSTSGGVNLYSRDSWMCAHEASSGYVFKSVSSPFHPVYFTPQC